MPIAVIAMTVLLLVMSAPRTANAGCEYNLRYCAECELITSDNGDRLCVKKDPLAGKPKPRPQESKPLVPIINPNPWNATPPPKKAGPAPPPAHQRGLFGQWKATTRQPRFRRG